MKFERSDPIPEELEARLTKLIADFRANPAEWLQFGIDDEEKLRGYLVALEEGVDRYVSSCGTYVVAVRRVSAFIDGWPPMLHLSVKRTDREAFHDWRVMQEIKNALVGPECEAVELYPAQSRLVDTSNQYHLWAISTPGARFPFGFAEGAVMDRDVGGAKQRRRA